MSPRHGSLAKERCRSDRETHRFAEALSARQPGSKQTEHGWGQTRLSLTQRGRVLPAKKQRPTTISNPQSSPQTEWSCMSCRYFGNIKPLIPLQVTNVDISASHYRGKNNSIGSDWRYRKSETARDFPEPGDGELKLRVHAVALNRAESMYLLCANTKEF